MSAPEEKAAAAPDVALLSVPSAWMRFAHRRGVRRVLTVLLLAGIGLAAAFLLTPSRFTPAIPGDEALGTFFAGTLKANRDYTVLDPETTTLKHDEAARSVWPVYDYDASAGEVLEQRIAQAFAEGRAGVDEWKRQNPGKAWKVTTAQLERVRARPQRSRVGSEGTDLVRFLLGRRDEFWKALQAVVEDEDFFELARAGFDASVEAAAIQLAQKSGQGFVVAERELLLADRERGIVVRTLPGDPRRLAAPATGSYGAAPPERQVRDIDRIRDLSQVRAEIDRLALEEPGTGTPGLRRALGQVVRRALRPNLDYNDAETRRRQDEQRAQVKDVLLQFKRGEKIIGDGEQVTKTHLLIFGALRAAGRSNESYQVRWGGGLFAMLVCAALFEFGRRNVRKFRLRGRDGFLLAVVLVLQLLLVRGSLTGADLLYDLLRDRFPGRLPMGTAEALSALVPLALGSMLVRFLISSEAALIWTAAFAPLCGLLAGGSLQPAVAALVGGIVAADRIGHAGSRAAVFRAGFWTGCANVLVLGAFALFQGRFFMDETGLTLVGGFFGGALLVPLLLLLVAPLFELAFGYVTDIQLLQLANFNHPVLKDLIVQAPGTYHHGIVIGTLVEAAARGIGANPLLARVGAYYHDIGKGRNPLYFGENQKGENRHDPLTPQMSAQVIKLHVAEGVQAARTAKLPKPIVDFILQHHGTRLVGYFWHRAREEAERTGQPAPDESDFRYAGPKPQTREAALVMMGDMVVATSRNLASGTSTSLRALVDSAIQAVVAEGQLDECDLTLRDLERTALSFTRTLEGLASAQNSAPPGPGLVRPAVLRVLKHADLKRSST